ncbi:MAG TPA: EscU/YscU/HrcU family type III secretion system export apparatus switch protein [Cellvibrionaceae bacterium]|nr:EscU/YscU/HrcU family type III secretion system export apparatus switch protein [Cellvibrionaceae bacterium]HMW71306.1 EscU/YscU/HrcU family type III secretion system export apparatus switch protein [Cellvibrionaceae bacterium]HMY40288.1 EscU/YscU/HrcU family type III secretion system export apparatus switch protein [Marinagarivorans sp.]HNG61537.1 EscU/YscU/HrcU family type III secretion system export apparatus switch protein [Cellvibrionaceae bacterium]
METVLQKAVALIYDGKGAPQVSAKGSGDDAQAIIELAQKAGVPLCENAPLVDLLSRLELGDEIPQELYIAVAHIIAFAYQISQKAAPNVQEKTIMPGPQL